MLRSQNKSTPNPFFFKEKTFLISQLPQTFPYNDYFPIPNYNDIFFVDTLTIYEVFLDFA